MNIKTFDELFAEAQARQPQRKPRSEPKHNLQVDCVQWFSLQYPSLRGRLFAVPNGGHRSKTEAARLKAEGVVAGVSDLILLKSNHQYGALLIEMKTTARNSRQSDRQKEWQKPSLPLANTSTSYAVLLMILCARYAVTFKIYYNTLK